MHEIESSLEALILIFTNSSQTQFERQTCKMLVKKENLALCNPIGLILNSVFYTGISPIYWNYNSNTAKVITSKWSKIRCKSTLLIILMMTVKYTEGFISLTINNGIQLDSVYYVGKTLQLCGIWMTFGFHLHTATKCKAIVLLMNGIIRLWPIFR